MQVFNLVQRDYGIYTCSANNVLGSTTGEILVMQPSKYYLKQIQFLSCNKIL